MNVRPFVREDFPRLLELADMMQQETPEYRDDPIDHTKLLALGEAIVKQVEVPPPSFAYRVCGFVAENSTGIVGFFMGYMTNAYFGPKILSSDLGLYVTPEHRGGSAAVKLVRAYEEWAIARGAKAMMLGITTGLEEEKTFGLYQRLGFKKVGILCKKKTGGL